MKENKVIISTLLIIFIILFATGLAFAAGGNGNGGGSGSGTGNNTTPVAKVTIKVEFDKNTAKVGDYVNIIVTLTNSGNINFKNVIVSITPILSSNGLKFLSFTGSGSNFTYDDTTGIWNVRNFKTDAAGKVPGAVPPGTKVITITTQVQKEMAGKTLIASSKFDSIQQDVNSSSAADSNFVIPGPASSNSLIIENVDSGNGNSTGTGIDSGSSSGAINEGTVANALKNATSSSGLEALQNLNQATQGNSYDISNVTDPNSSNNSKTAYAVLGGLIIVFLVAIGYFKGIKS